MSGPSRNRETADVSDDVVFFVARPRIGRLRVQRRLLPVAGGEEKQWSLAMFSIISFSPASEQDPGPIRPPASRATAAADAAAVAAVAAAVEEVRLISLLFSHARAGTHPSFLPSNIAPSAYSPSAAASAASSTGSSVRSRGPAQGLHSRQRRRGLAPGHSALAAVAPRARRVG